MVKIESLFDEKFKRLYHMQLGGKIQEGG